MSPKEESFPAIMAFRPAYLVPLATHSTEAVMYPALRLSELQTNPSLKQLLNCALFMPGVA